VVGERLGGLQAAQLLQERQEHQALGADSAGRVLRADLALQLLELLLLLQHLLLLPPLELQLFVGLVDQLLGLQKTNPSSTKSTNKDDTQGDCSPVTFSMFLFSKYSQVAKPPTATKYTPARRQFYLPFTAVLVHSAHF
jgi:hypothetical protein